ncbi:MAG: hypothetical protein FGM27_04220 [Candidatus Omnitrophica bacterium]|nr:hypothetical protein [Candidatus Omnitrophota bacterium]
MAAFAIWFSVLLSFWCLLSGQWDPFHFGSGILSCAAAAFFAARQHEALTSAKLLTLPGKALRFTFYLFWLAQRIVMAAWHVACVVLDPALRIHPKISTRTSVLQGDKNLAVFGTSITLTPGTITIDIQGRDVLVHELDGDSAGDIVSGAMEQAIDSIAGGGKSR